MRNRGISGLHGCPVCGGPVLALELFPRTDEAPLHRRRIYSLAASALCPSAVPSICDAVPDCAYLSSSHSWVLAYTSRQKSKRHTMEKHLEMRSFMVQPIVNLKKDHVNRAINGMSKSDRKYRTNR